MQHLVITEHPPVSDVIEAPTDHLVDIALGYVHSLVPHLALANVIQIGIDDTVATFGELVCFAIVNA